MLRRLSLVAVVLSAQPAYAEWVSGSVTGPSGGSVIVDTGTLAGPAARAMCVTVSAVDEATFLLQHRDAANSANVHEQSLVITKAGGTVSLCVSDAIAGTLADGERLRVTVSAAVSGPVQASIWYQGI